MKMQVRTVAWSLMVVVIVSVFAMPSASAGPLAGTQWYRPPVNNTYPNYPSKPHHPNYPTNPNYPTPSTPRLGMMSHIEYGRGMVVDSVNHGSLAARMGLERGDMIVRINDRRIATDRDYQEALWSSARYLDGYVDLAVVDVWTGRTTHRTGYLVTGSGPIVPRVNTRVGANW